LLSAAYSAGLVQPPAPGKPGIAPEPVSLSLFGAGLVGLGVLLRRRRRAGPLSAASS
jgi:hypothetical protein